MYRICKTKVIIQQKCATVIQKSPENVIKMSLVSVISPWEDGPILIAPNYTRIWSWMLETAGGAPHGPHADLIIGFAADLA